MRGAGLKKKIQLFFGDKVFSVMFLLTVLFIFLAVISVIIPVKDKAEYVINTKQTTTVGEIYDGTNLSFLPSGSSRNFL
jgi:type IV secretory pathway component VirB8